MKLQTKIKAVCAAVALTASTAATAVPFYINVGTDYGGPGAKAAGGTTTGFIDEITYRYASKTFVTDANSDGVFSPGDTVLGTGGLLKAAGITITGVSNTIANNKATDLLPARATIFTPGDPAANGFNTTWQLSFGWDNLVGIVNAVGGITYSSGTIRMYLFDSTFVPVGGGAGGAGGVEVMNLNVTGGGNNAIGQSLNLVGTLSIVNAATVLGGSTVGALFNFMDGSTFGSKPGNSIFFETNQNTDPFFVNGSTSPTSVLNPFTFYAAVGGTGTLEGIHDGSMTVPEPASLALVGLGLFGLAALRRRSRTV